MSVLRGMEIGDRIRIHGMTGRVVGVITEDKFSPDHPPEQWAHLEVGILVDTNEAGVIHYPNLDGIKVEKTSIETLPKCRKGREISRKCN